jgi:hypothetical protein
VLGAVRSVQRVVVGLCILLCCVALGIIVQGELQLQCVTL